MDVHSCMDVSTSDYGSNWRRERPRAFRWSLLLALVFALLGPLIRVFHLFILSTSLGPLIAVILWFAPALVPMTFVASACVMGFAPPGKRLMSALPLAVNTLAVMLWTASAYLQWSFIPSDTDTLSRAWRANEVAYQQLAREMCAGRLHHGTSERTLIPLGTRIRLAGLSQADVFGDPRHPSLYVPLKGPGLIGGWDAYGYLYTTDNPDDLRYGDGPFETTEQLGASWYLARW